MIICKICNPNNPIANGYCSEHSTSGTAYFTPTPLQQGDIDKKIEELAKRTWFFDCDERKVVKDFFLLGKQAGREEVVEITIDKVKRYTHDRSASGYDDIMGSCGEPCHQCDKDKKLMEEISSLRSKTK